MAMENPFIKRLQPEPAEIFMWAWWAGPTGKSTLIKRVMEELVIPNISDPYRKERARDELPPKRLQ